MNPTVLLVEDDDDGRDMLIEMLTPLAVRVHAATNGRDGIELFDRARPDLAISDVTCRTGAGSS